MADVFFFIVIENLSAQNKGPALSLTSMTGLFRKGRFSETVNKYEKTASFNRFVVVFVLSFLLLSPHRHCIIIVLFLQR